jgi:hypothetical protein
MVPGDQNAVMAPPMDRDDNAAHMTDDAVRQQTRFGGGLGV